MLKQLETIEVLPLSVVNNCFVVRLSELETDEFIHRNVPKNLYALVYRKGADPRCTKVTETIFMSCDICCDDACSCDRERPIIVECPATYFWIKSNEGGGIDYTFEVDKRLWGYTPGNYVVEIVVPADETLPVSTMDAGIWSACCPPPKKCCNEPLEDKSCKLFEFCVPDCFIMNIELTTCPVDPIIIDVPVDEIEIPEP